MQNLHEVTFTIHVSQKPVAWVANLACCALAKKLSKKNVFLQ
jgi:hypothetical protein